MFEQYAIILEYPTYAISTYGQVLNVKTGRMLKLKTNKKDYNYVTLYKNKITKNEKVYKLMTDTF